MRRWRKRNPPDLSEERQWAAGGCWVGHLAPTIWRNNMLGYGLSVEGGVASAVPGSPFASAGSYQEGLWRQLKGRHAGQLDLARGAPWGAGCTIHSSGVLERAYIPLSV